MDNQLKKYLEKIDEIEIDLNVDDQQVGAHFEATKTKFKTMIEETIADIKGYELGDISKALLAKLEDLRVQLALGRADTRDAFEAQKSKIYKARSEVKAEIEKLGEGDILEKLRDKYGELSADLENRLEIFRLNFSLGKADLDDEINGLRGEMHTKLEQIREKLIDERGETKQRLEEFGVEMNSAFEHFKGALKKLFP